MPSGRTVLLFTRAPEVEARAKRLPLAEGACLFAGFLRGWQDRARGAGADLLVVTPASSQTTLARLLPQAGIAAQAGESFAARIEAAFALAFERGASAVLMVGGDGPPLELSDIHAAFAHLESDYPALALTPSDDGGVNAIGFNAQAERSLSGIAWQSSDVFRQLTSEGLRCGLALFLTSAGHDLDGAANVAALYRVSRDASSWAAFRWLLLSLLLVCRSTVRFFVKASAAYFAGSIATRGPPRYSIA